METFEQKKEMFAQKRKEREEWKQQKKEIALEIIKLLEGKELNYKRCQSVLDLAKDYIDNVSYIKTPDDCNE